MKLTWNYLLWIAAIILDKVFGIIYGYYIVYGMLILILMANSGTNNELKLHLIFYSILLPDNYSQVVLFITLFVLETIRSKKINKYLVGIFIYIFINAILNYVPKVNIVMGLMYFLPGIILYPEMKEICKGKENIAELVFVEVLNVQMLATFMSFILHVITHSNNPDWANGTMRLASTYVLMLMMSFASIKYLYEGLTERSLKKILYGVCTLSCSIAASCETMFYMMLEAILIYLLLRSIVKLRFYIVIPSVLIGIIVINQLLHIGDAALILTNASYREYRVAKISAYEDIYINESDRDAFYAVFGNGIGYGASRGAITCTGKYINSYNSLLTPSISDFTNRTIYQRMPYVNDNHNSILNMPYASMLSIMGDFGYIGVLIFLLFFLTRAKGNLLKHLLILAFLVSCLVDFTFEYPKVMCSFYVILFLSDKTENKIDFSIAK